MIRQKPISLTISDRREVRSQFAALCYRIKNDKLKILLITTRNTGRWTLPKGWPMEGKTPAQAALQEAWEEAGIKGETRETCLGIYSYQKTLDDTLDVPTMAMVYPVEVTTVKNKFPEAGERKVKWFSPKKAAEMVAEPELKAILLSFDPKHLL